MARMHIISLLTMLFLTSSLGAQTVNDALELDKGTARSAADLLKGRLSGVRVSSIDGTADGAFNLNIRGLNSLRGNNQPLWVIDGCIVGTSAQQNLEAFFQYDEDGYTNPTNLLGYINVYDIESIDVLKNTSATALYGSKGANGVILINTKKSTKEDKVEIDWNSNFYLSLPSKKADGSRTGFNHNHWVRASGLNNKASYSFSAYFNGLTGLTGTRTNKGGIRANFETRTNDVLWFGLNSLVSVSGIATPSTGSWYGKPSMGTAMRGISIPGIQNDSVEGWKTDFDDDTKDFRTTNTIWLTVNILPQLKWKTSAGLDFDNSNRYIWYGNNTYMGAKYNGAASIVESKVMSYNAKTEFSYSTFIKLKHHLNATLAVVAEGDNNKFSTMNGNNFWTHAMRAKGLSISGSKAVIRNFNYNYFHFASFASLSYDYNGIAGLDALCRIDTTPRYDDWKMTLYPSAEAWFDIRKTFFPDRKAVSGLKLVAGWGRSGKENFVPYQLMPLYTSGQYPEVQSDVAYFFESMNRLKSSELNVGLKTAFLEDRIRLDATYYRKSTSDAIDMYSFGKPGKDGIVWVFDNRKMVYSQQAVVANRGLEFDLNAYAVKTSEWKWDINLNFSYSENQLTRVDRPDRLGRDVGSGVLANVNVLGYSAGCLYGYELNPDGSYKDLTGDGKITAVDKTLLGTTQPRFYGALGSTLSYKNFTLDFIFNGAADYKLLNMNRMLKDNEFIVSDRYAERADYLRLSRMSLAYDFGFVSKVKWLNSLRVFVSSDNLFTLTGYSGWNPDVNSFGISNLSTGFDYGSLPAARTILLGVSVKF